MQYIIPSPECCILTDRIESSWQYLLKHYCLVAKIVKAVNVEVPNVGHCYPYYLVSVLIDSGILTTIQKALQIGSIGSFTTPVATTKA